VQACTLLVGLDQPLVADLAACHHRRSGHGQATSSTTVCSCRNLLFATGRASHPPLGSAQTIVSLAPKPGKSYPC
jgi:hypothetical protein